MLMKILGWTPFPWSGSKRRSTHSKRGKRKSKRIHPQFTQETSGGKRKFTQTTPKERDHMFELRSKGYSVHNIADQLSRSSRTVHRVLTVNGTQPLPEPDEQLAASESEVEEQEEPGRRKRPRRGRRRETSTRGKGEESASLWGSLDPMLDRMAKNLLDTNENFALHVLAAKLGIKVPDVTVDDMIQREIRRDPDLMRRLAEARVDRLLHRGKTEMELAEEVFGLVIKISEWKETGNWAGVVEKVFASGEVSKLVEAFVRIKSTGQQPASGETFPPPYWYNFSPPLTATDRNDRQFRHGSLLTIFVGLNIKAKSVCRLCSWYLGNRALAAL